MDGNAHEAFAKDDPTHVLVRGEGLVLVDDAEEAVGLLVLAHQVVSQGLVPEEAEATAGEELRVGSLRKSGSQALSEAAEKGGQPVRFDTVRREVENPIRVQCGDPLSLIEGREPIEKVRRGAQVPDRRTR